MKYRIEYINFTKKKFTPICKKCQILGTDFGTPLFTSAVVVGIDVVLVGAVVTDVVVVVGSVVVVGTVVVPNFYSIHI